MLEFYNSKDIDKRLSTFLGRGKSSTVFDIGDNLVCKKYGKPTPLNAVNKITNLPHFERLSQVETKTFFQPIGITIDKFYRSSFGVNTSEEYISSLIIHKAFGKILLFQKLTLEGFLPFENQAIADIKELSKKFYIKDLNLKNILFSETEGIAIIDMDQYRECNRDASSENLRIFYSTILYAIYSSS